MALTVPMFLSYRLHAGFQFFKIMTSIWNGAPRACLAPHSAPHAMGRPGQCRREMQETCLYDVQYSLLYYYSVLWSTLQ